MPISVLCPKCQKKLTAPDAVAGKRAKCPHCGQVMMIPALPKPPEEAAPPDAGGGLPGLSEKLPDLDESSDIYGVQQNQFGGMNGAQFDDILAAVGPKIDRPPSEPERYPCPACGEMIVRGAAKCRYCDEIFDPVLKQKQRKKEKRK